MSRLDIARLRDARDRAADAYAIVSRVGAAAIWDSREARQSLLLDLIWIGEALGKVSDPVQSLAPGVPWRAINGLRNRLVHEYWLQDASIVQRMVADDLAPLIVALDDLVALLGDQT